MKFHSLTASDVESCAKKWGATITAELAQRIADEMNKEPMPTFLEHGIKHGVIPPPRFYWVPGV